MSFDSEVPTKRHCEGDAVASQYIIGGCRPLCTELLDNRMHFSAAENSVANLYRLPLPCSSAVMARLPRNHSTVSSAERVFTVMDLYAKVKDWKLQKLGEPGQVVHMQRHWNRVCSLAAVARPKPLIRHLPTGTVLL